MIDNDKFTATKLFYLHGIEPVIDIYDLKSFRRLIRYRIKYQIIKNKQQKYMRKKTLIAIKKDLNKLETLEKEHEEI